MKQRRKKALRASILAFAVAAIASPAAQAGGILVDGGAGPAPAAKTTAAGPTARGTQAVLGTQQSFNWGDAGIGAGATFVLLGGLAVAARNRPGRLAV